MIRHNKLKEINRLFANGQREKALKLVAELTEKEKLFLVQMRLSKVVKFLTDRNIDPGIEMDIE